MARGGKIQIDFMAKATDKVSATMKKVNGSVKGAGKSAGAAAGKMGKLNIAMAAIAAAAVVAGKKLLDLANETAAYGDNVAKTSTRLGMSVEEFQRLDHALKISGSSMEAQKGSFVRLARVADDANSGLKTAQEAFDRLGVSVTDADGILKNQPQLLAEVADAFARTADGTEKTALAAELFGRKGTDLLQFLNLGSEGIRKLGDEAESLGAVMSGEAARAAESYTDSVTRLEAAWDGLKRALGSEVMPMIQGVVDFLTRVLKPTENATQAIRSYGDIVRRESKATADQIVRDSQRIAGAMAAQVDAAKGNMVAQGIALKAQADASAATAKSAIRKREIERELRQEGLSTAVVERLNQQLRKNAGQLELELQEIKARSVDAIKAENAATKQRIKLAQQQGRVLRGEDERTIEIESLKAQAKAAAAKGLDDEAEALNLSIEDLKDAIHLDKQRVKSTGSRTRATKDNTAALLKNIEAQRASAETMLESARAELQLARTPEGFERQRAALEMEMAKIKKAARATEFTDIQAEDDRKLALAYQLKNKEIELEKLTADRKAEINRDAREKDQAANAKSLEDMRAQQSASLALFEQTSSKAAGELGGMNKQLGATAGAVGETAAQWQKYSNAQGSIGTAVAGSAAAIGAATGAFVDSEREKAGILSAMHTAQAIALAFSPNPAAAIAHAAAAAMFFGIATGAIKTASPGGGGGGGAGGSVGTPEPSGFTGGDGGGGESRAINVTFGGGIVLGRPSDVAQAIAQAEFAARGQGRMGGGI